MSEELPIARVHALAPGRHSKERGAQPSGSHAVRVVALGVYVREAVAGLPKLPPNTLLQPHAVVEPRAVRVRSPQVRRLSVHAVGGVLNASPLSRGIRCGAAVGVDSHGGCRHGTTPCRACQELVERIGPQEDARDGRVVPQHTHSVEQHALSGANPLPVLFKCQEVWCRTEPEEECVEAVRHAIVGPKEERLLKCKLSVHGSALGIV